MSYRDAVTRLHPLGYWLCDGPVSQRNMGSGGSTLNATITSPNHTTGSVARGIVGGRTYTDGEGGSANDSYFTVPGNGTGLNLSAFTMIMWMRSYVGGARRQLIGRDSGTSGDDRAFFFAVQSGGNFQFVDNGSIHAFSGTRTDLHDGRPHLVGFYYTTNVLEFWCDGVLDNSFSSSVTAPSSTGLTDMLLRRHNTSNESWRGPLGHVAILNRRLGPSDWRYLYQAGMS